MTINREQVYVRKMGDKGMYTIKIFIKQTEVTTRQDKKGNVFK